MATAEVSKSPTRNFVSYEPVDRRRDLSLREFKSEYFRRKPVVIEDGFKEWPAHSSWRLETFKARYGKSVITAYPYVNGAYKRDAAKQMQLGDYIEKIQSSDFDSFPYYLIYDYSLLHQHPELWADFSEPALCFDWFRFFPSALRFPSPRVYLGPRGAVSNLHQDRWDTHFWMAQLEGRKRWILFSPDQVGLLYRAGGNSRELVSFSVIPEQPDFDRFPLLRQAKGVECTIKQGDLLICPGGWVHWVKSLDATLSLTHNYMGPGNFWPALKGQLSWSTEYLFSRFRQKN